MAQFKEGDVEIAEEDWIVKQVTAYVPQVSLLFIISLSTFPRE